MYRDRDRIIIGVLVKDKVFGATKDQHCLAKAWT